LQLFGYQINKVDEVPQDTEEIKVDSAFKLVTRVDSPLYEGYNFGKYNPNQLYKKKGGYRIFDEMREDDQINAVLNLIKYIILGSAWDIECEDNEEVPDFIKKNLNEQLDEIFIKKLYNVLTGMEYGFSLTEKVFEECNGKIILSSLKTRPPHSFDFQQDKFGKVIDIIQTVTDGEIHLDPSKFIHYAYQEEFDNPYGKSALNQGVYRAWWSKNAIIKFYNIYIERHGMPFGIATYPKGTPQPQIDDLKKIGKNIQAKSFMVAPEGVTIDFKEAQKGADVFTNAINQHNTSIARNMLLPDLLGLSGSQTGGGSYALGDKQFEIFYQTVDFERRKLERLITDEIIKPLVQWNFGNDIEAHFSFTPVDKTEKRELMKIWLDGVKSGKIPITNDHINWFLSAVEAPEISDEDLQAMQDEKDAQAAAIQGGQPNPNEQPNQGGNSNDPNAIKQAKEGDKKAGEKVIPEDKKAIEKDKNSKDDKAGTKVFSSARVLNKYEKKVDFTAIENKLNELEKKYVNSIADGFKLSINALVDEIKRKKIVEKKRFDLINKLQLKYQPSMIKTIKDMLRDSYEAGHGSVTKEYLIEDINELDEEDVANWIKYFAEQITGAEADKIAKIVKQLLGEGIRTGASIRDIIKQIDVALKGYDIALESFQIETLVRTVVSTAYNEGRGQQFGEIGDEIIGFTYSAVLDGRETDLCHTLDQSLISKADFNLYNAPNHYNCRSLLLPVFKGEGEGEDGNIFEPNAPAVVRTQGNFLELA
jgi:SPP1 gp7 family putative phage head morphogenesis protein